MADQWEKDLREQLNKNKTWEDKLVDEIKDVKPQPKQHNTIIMVVLLVILSIATLFAYDAKTGSIQKLFKHETIEKPIIKSYDSDIQSLKDDIKRIDNENKTKIDKLTDKVKWNGDRLTLMGVMVNENFLILRDNQAKSELIFFNRDWTLDRMPHYTEISEADKEYLKKYIK